MGRGYRKFREDGARLAGGGSGHGMTDPELAALGAYSGDDRKWGGRELNGALWSRSPLSPEHDAMGRTLLDALDKLPDHPVRELRRGVQLSSDELPSLARYRRGRIVTEHGFTSASVGQGFGGNVRFVIHGKRGKLIKDFSANRHEDEVLFRAGTRFEVLRRYDDDGGTVHIVMEEVDDD